MKSSQSSRSWNRSFMKWVLWFTVLGSLCGQTRKKMRRKPGIWNELTLPPSPSLLPSFPPLVPFSSSFLSPSPSFLSLFLIMRSTRNSNNRTLQANVSIWIFHTDSFNSKAQKSLGRASGLKIEESPLVLILWGMALPGTKSLRHLGTTKASGRCRLDLCKHDAMLHTGIAGSDSEHLSTDAKRRLCYDRGIWQWQWDQVHLELAPPLPKGTTVSPTNKTLSSSKSPSESTYRISITQTQHIGNCSGVGVHVDRNHAFLLIHFLFHFFIFTMWIYIHIYCTWHYITYYIDWILYITCYIYYHIRIVSYTHIFFHCVFKTLSTHVLFKYKEKPRGGIKFYLLPENISGSVFLSDLVTSHPSTCTTPRSSQLSPFPRLDSVLVLSIEQSQR